MSFISVIIYSYITVACLLVYFIIRDSKINGLFFNKYKKLGHSLVVILIFGIFAALYSHFIEPFILTVKTVEIKSSQIKDAVQIVFISDIQVGKHKKSAWVEKIAEKIITINPDLVIFGGDLIANEGTFENESVYLQPLAKIAEKYPSFYVLGNHEHGLGHLNLRKTYLGTGNRTQELIDEMKKLKIVSLNNSLSCLNVRNQELCLFGTDDVYAGKADYFALKNLPTSTPLLFVTHNPDGILSYPKTFPKPLLTLAGHTHGGQVYLPLFGPLGRVDLILPNNFYRGLNYWQELPVYTSIGAGESGGQVRFLAWPEIISLKLTP